MLKVALTGGIATGKSYVRAGLEARGIPTIDADRLAREAVMPGTPAWQQILDRFGPALAGPDGQIDRPRLAEMVFADVEARRALEAIVHPPVYERLQRWFTRLEHARTVPVAVADVPLLYETGRAGSFDRVIVVACGQDEQIRRVMQRDALTADQARRRLEAQLPLDEKAARADLVIRTDGTYAETDRQVEEVAARLRAGAGC